MPPRNLLFIVLTAIVSFACYSKAERNRYATQIADAMQVVSNLYVDNVKERDLFEHAMSGMLEGLDQYSSYIGPDGFKQIEQSLEQEFGGVGIEVEKESDNSPILILSPLFDSPGYRAGLRSGDLILAIGGENTVGMKQKDAVGKMRGKPGTKVQLRIRHASSPDPVEIEVERATITVDSLLGDVRRPDGTWDFHLRTNPRLGYLRLTSFGEHSTQELSKALGGGKDCPFDAIILDLRDNAGGLLDAAVATCDLFLDGGRIVSTRGRDGRDRSVFDATPSTVIPANIPMVVLVNRFSASAAEIVAACLQDHQRAVVIGERSFGKGTVQNLFELEGGISALKLTTATYWRPSGQNIHRRTNAPENEDWGVKPNSGFELKFTVKQMEAVYRARRELDIGRKLPVPETRAAPEKNPNQPPELDQQPGTPDTPATSPEKTPGTPPESTNDHAEKNPPAAPDEPPATGEDLQLRRAVEYLESKLARPSIAAQL